MFTPSSDVFSPSRSCSITYLDGVMIFKAD
jgi:hypothetical protein